MDSTLLLWHVKKHGDNWTTLANAMGLHPHTLYLKRKEAGYNPQQFTQSEIQFIAKRYNLTPEDICKIFFNGIS